LIPSAPGPAASGDWQAAWRQLDVEVTPGHYHFVAQAPRVPMRFQRAAVMRGHEIDLDGQLGAGEVTLTIHDKPGGPGRTAIPDAELAHFDVDAAGSVHARAV
jgi:hypothetical protein